MLRKSLHFSLVLIAAIATLSFSDLASAAEPSPTGIWLFDEGKGDIAKDSSGNGYDGKITNAKWVDGKYDKALEFPGYVDIPDAPELNPGKDFSIVAWFTVSELVLPNSRLVSKRGADGTGGYILTHQSDNTIVLQTNRAPWQNYVISVTKFLPSKNWYHIAVSFDGKTTNLYINGELESTGSQFTDKFDATATPLTIGCESTHGGDKLWGGIIDEVALYKGILTGSNVKRIMEEGLKSFMKGASVSKKENLSTTWGELKHCKLERN